MPAIRIASVIGFEVGKLIRVRNKPEVAGQAIIIVGVTWH